MGSEEPPRRAHQSPHPNASRLRAIQLLHTAIEDPDGFGPGFEITGVRVDGPGVEGGSTALEACSNMWAN